MFRKSFPTLRQHAYKRPNTRVTKLCGRLVQYKLIELSPASANRTRFLNLETIDPSLVFFSLSPTLHARRKHCGSLWVFAYRLPDYQPVPRFSGSSQSAMPRKTSLTRSLNKAEKREIYLSNGSSGNNITQRGDINIPEHHYCFTNYVFWAEN